MTDKPAPVVQLLDFFERFAALAKQPPTAMGSDRRVIVVSVEDITGDAGSVTEDHFEFEDGDVEVVINALRAASRSTPSSSWHTAGEPDPFGARYDCERAALLMGNLTDDELANAVYLHGDERPPIAEVVAGRALLPIAYLSAAKDRIRWLSRALERTLK